MLEQLPISITDGGKGWYKNNQFKVDKVGDPLKNPAGAVDGDSNFVALEATTNSTVHIQNGDTQIGKELKWDGRQEFASKKTQIL